MKKLLNMQVHDIIFQNYMKMINCENATSYESTLNQVIDLIELLDKYYGPWKEINYGVKLLNIHQLDIANPFDIFNEFQEFFKSKLDELDQIAAKEGKRWKLTSQIPFRRVELLQFANQTQLKNYSYFKLSQDILSLVQKTENYNAKADEAKKMLETPDLSNGKLHDIDWKLHIYNSEFKPDKYLADDEIPEWAINNEIIKKFNESVKRILDLRQIIKLKEEAKQQQLVDWAKSIEITPQVRKQYFKNYGYMNGWDEKTTEEYRKSSALHDIDVKNHPQLHKSESSQPYRCVSVWKCSCGLGYAVDSSD